MTVVDVLSFLGSLEEEAIFLLQLLARVYRPEAKESQKRKKCATYLAM